MHRSPADRFAAAMRAIVGRLPFGLAGRVAPSLVGFLLLNSITFAVDLTLLGTLHGVAHWPLPAAISLAYATAFALNFTLNRTLWILGLAHLLAWGGVDYRVARVAGGACEAAYMYAALRWVVFRPRAARPAPHGSIEG